MKDSTPSAARHERFARSHERLFAVETTTWLRLHWRHDNISLVEFRHLSPLREASAKMRRRVVARLEQVGVLMRADGLQVLGTKRVPAWCLDWIVVDVLTGRRPR